MATKGQKLMAAIQAAEVERETAIQLVEEEFDRKYQGDKLRSPLPNKRVCVTDYGHILINNSTFDPHEAVTLANWLLDMCQEETE